MYRSGNDVYIRMSKESFNKMEIAFKEIVEQKPKSELAVKIIDAISLIKDKPATKVTGDFYYEFSTRYRKNFLPDIADENHRDFRLYQTDWNKSEIVVKFLELAAKQDDNYDIVVIRSNDGRVIQEECNSGTFDKSPLKTASLVRYDF